MNRKIVMLTTLLMLMTAFRVQAQDEPIVYTSEDIKWSYLNPLAYTGNALTPSLFLNVALGEEGQLYVANFLSVLVFDATTGDLIDAIQDDSGTVIQYDDVAAAGDGNIWVADSKGYAAHLLDADGNVLTTIPANTTDDPDKRISPLELAVGPDDNLYVLYNDGNTTILVFTPEGEFLRSFDMGDRTLSTGVIDFAFAADGNIYVAGVRTVRVLDTEGNIIIEQFAQEYFEENPLDVRGVALDADGNVYVGGSDYYSQDSAAVNTVYKFDADGQLLGQFGRAQERVNWAAEFAPEELSFTVSLLVLPEGQLVISDSNSAYSQLLAVDMSR